MLKRKAITLLLLTLEVLFFSSFSFAQTQSDAISAANTIIGKLNNRQYQELYDQNVSSYFKKAVVRSQFVANLTLGRQGLPQLTHSEYVGVDYTANGDPNFNYNGPLYSITFKNTYGNQQFYERIVIVRDVDGVLRLGGIWGPAK